MLATLKPDHLREARDAALLALGWAAALRRSELVGLDWGKLGTGKDDSRVGYLSADDKGLTVTLMRSKASQDTAETLVIPRAFCPSICEAIENWVRFAKIEVGSPLFRGTDGRLRTTRMQPSTVARVIKRRIHVLIKARTKGGRRMTRTEIAELTAAFSGHSMRAGYVTTACEIGLPDRDIQQQTRHKTSTMLGVYRREVDKFKSSGLKGVGF
jgi:integrase